MYPFFIFLRNSKIKRIMIPMRIVTMKDSKNGKKAGSFSQTRKDFQNVWFMLKSNYKAFISTELFAITAFILIVVSLFSILIAIVAVIPDFSVEDLRLLFEESFNISLLFRFIVWIAFIGVLMGFMNTQFGLANDIMNSGEMFAEFKGSFYYFKKNWAQFFLLTLLLLFIPPMLPMGIMLRNSTIEITVGFSWARLGILLLNFVFNSMFFLILIHAFPSLAYKNNLKIALKESFEIFRRDFKRITRTWAVYLIIFLLPISLISIIGILFNGNIPQNGPYPLVSVGFVIFEILLGYPLMTLLATGIYNNSVINHEENISNGDES